MNSSNKSVGEQTLDIIDMKRSIYINVNASDLPSLACVNQSNHLFFQGLANSNTDIDKSIFNAYSDAKMMTIGLKDNLKNIANYKTSIHKNQTMRILFIIKDNKDREYLDNIFKRLGVVKKPAKHSYDDEILTLASKPCCEIDVYDFQKGRGSNVKHFKLLTQYAGCIFLVGELRGNNKDAYVDFIPEFFNMLKKYYWSQTFKEKPVHVVLQGKLEEDVCNKMIADIKSDYTSEWGEFHCHIGEKPVTKISEVILGGVKAHLESLDKTIEGYYSFCRQQDQFDKMLSELDAYTTTDPVWTLNAIEKMYQGISLTQYYDQGLFGRSDLKEQQIKTLEKTFMEVLKMSLNHPECKGDVLVGIVKIVKTSKLMDRNNYFGDNEAQKMLNSKMEALMFGKK